MALKFGGEEAGARHRRSFSVRNYESDHHGRLRLTCLLDYFQEAAGEHAEKLGAGVVGLKKRNMTWVISRYHIRVFRYPRCWENVELTTWPSGTEGLFARREFELSDEKGGSLAAATTSWMLIDLKSKRPVPPAESLGPYPQDPRRAIVTSFEPLPTLAKVHGEISFSVRFGDLDWNRHVNHVVYAEWALETTPLEILEKCRPEEIEIDFRGEAFLDDRILSRIEAVPRGEKRRFHHQIFRAEDLKELARLRILWRG